YFGRFGPDTYVAGDVGVGTEPAEVRLDVAIGVAPDRPSDPRPWVREHEVPTAAEGNGGSGLVDDVRRDPGEGDRRRPRRQPGDARERRDQDRPGLRLPPRVHDRTPLTPDHGPVPD